MYAEALSYPMFEQNTVNLSIAVTVGTAQYDRYGQVAAMERFMTCHSHEVAQLCELVR